MKTFHILEFDKKKSDIKFNVKLQESKVFDSFLTTNISITCCNYTSLGLFLLVLVFSWQLNFIPYILPKVLSFLGGKHG
jgi:hypothetical protein